MLDYTVFHKDVNGADPVHAAEVEEVAPLNDRIFNCYIDDIALAARPEFDAVFKVAPDFCKEAGQGFGGFRGCEEFKELLFRRNRDLDDDIGFCDFGFPVVPDLPYPSVFCLQDTDMANVVLFHNFAGD